jgi:hypothetical protein
MNPGDLIVCWCGKTPKRIRRLEHIEHRPDGTKWYWVSPVAPGFEGMYGAYCDHAEPLDMEQLDRQHRERP